MENDSSFRYRPCLHRTLNLFCVIFTYTNVIASTHAQVGPFPFQNTSLAWSQRVNDLVSRLSLDEIQLQMTRGGGGAPAIPRLGIQQFDWTTECLHGAADYNGNATAFPQSIGLAAAFSPDLLYRVATAIGMEVRGKHNYYVKQGQFFSHTGATCFSPVINIARDPRWGRNQETYGEDPFLTGVLAQQFVWGLQGNHSRFVQATAGCKHFDAYAGPENIPVSRFTFDAQVSDVDWHTKFLPAFKKCVQAGTFSLMCSYNRTYRYMDTNPLYPFGYGLSYSNFTYTQLTVSYTVLPRHNISVSVSVENIGQYDADEVVQCYIQWQDQSLPVPHIQLVYFNRIRIDAQKEVTHNFNVEWENWSYWNNGSWAVQTGTIRFFCGGQQPFQAKTVPSNVRSVQFQVIGDDSTDGHLLPDAALRQTHDGRPVPPRNAGL